MHLERFAMGALVVGLAACSTSTTLTEVWRDPNFSAAPMRKIAVFGATNNEAQRRALEDSFASALSRHTVQALPSYNVYQDRQIDRSAAQRWLEKEGYDGALVVRLTGIQTHVTLEPGADFVGYYGWTSGYYVDTDQYVKVETTLWNARNGKLVWSASSETENPTSSSDAISSLTAKIITSLTSERLIPPSPAVALRVR
jgi:hypothetical protein